MVRPTFKPTATMRRRVAIAAGGGMSHEQIALGLGIARNTLEKHFERELSVGAFAKRLEVLDVLHATARKGNVAAQKAYLSLTPRETALPAQPDAPAPKTRAEGKKAEAAAAAINAQAGTDWESLLPGSPLQ